LRGPPTRTSDPSRTLPSLDRFELRDFPLENLSRPPQARRYRPLRDLQQRSNLRHRHFLEGMQHEHRSGRILHDLEDPVEQLSVSFLLDEVLGTERLALFARQHI